MEACLVTFLHACTIVLRSKHNVGQWCCKELLIFHVCPHIVLDQMVFYHFFLGIKCRAWTQQEKCFAGTCTAICERTGSKRIAHHLRKTLHVGNDLRLIGQHCTVEILHDAADSIDQRRVVRIFVVHEDRALANNLQRLADGILLTKETPSQSFCDNALVWRIENCPFVSLR